MTTPQPAAAPTASETAAFTFPDPSYVIAALEEELRQATTARVYLAAALRQTQVALSASQQHPAGQAGGE